MEINHKLIINDHLNLLYKFGIAAYIGLTFYSVAKMRGKSGAKKGEDMINDAISG